MSIAASGARSLALAALLSAALCPMAPAQQPEPPDRVLDADGIAHEIGVSALAVTPDGRRLISGGWDKTLLIWDLERGAPAAGPLVAHTGSIRRIALGPEGRLAYSVGDDGTLARWDLETASPIGARWPVHRGAVHDVEITADGRVLTLGRDGTLLSTEAGTGVRIARLDVVPEAVALAAAVPPPPPDGDPRFRAGEFAAMRHWPRDMALAPDGRRAAIVGNDGLLRLWDVIEGAPLAGGAILAHDAGITSVALTPDGATVVTASVDGTLRRWRLDDGSPAGETLTGPGAAIYAIAMHPTKPWLLAGDMAGTVLLWDLDAGRVLRVLDAPGGRTYAVELSPDGCWAAAGGELARIYLWRLCE